MSQTERLQLRLSAADRALLRRLAVHLRRSQSDTVRWLIYEATRELERQGLLPAEGETARPPEVAQ